MPKIENFSEKIDYFIEDNKQMRECIVSFDEALS